MRIEIKRRAGGWDVVEGDVVVAQAATRSDAIAQATTRVRSTGQALQIIAEADAPGEVADVA
jgi:hypothetical protein